MSEILESNLVSRLHLPFLVMKIVGFLAKHEFKLAVQGYSNQLILCNKLQGTSLKVFKNAVVLAVELF